MCFVGSECFVLNVANHQVQCSINSRSVLRKGITFFRNIFLIKGGAVFLNFMCNFGAAIVIGLENPTFLVKRDIFIPKCTKGEGDPPVWKFWAKKSGLGPLCISVRPV